MNKFQSNTKQEPATIWETPDELWDKIAPLLAIEKPRKKMGRPRKNDRAIFDGLIYLARTGAQWCALPKKFGAKSTVYDRYREWVEHGCLQQAWTLLLQEYERASRD
jgi:putative transposase